jgi:hypothetical protein
MIINESDCERLLHESKGLREIAVDLIEHATLLINKSVEIDRHIAKAKRRQSQNTDSQIPWAWSWRLLAGKRGRGQTGFSKRGPVRQQPIRPLPNSIQGRNQKWLSRL